MTSPNIEGLDLDEQVRLLGEELKRKEELRKFRDEVKREVIKELEKEYKFKDYMTNMDMFSEKFNNFIDLLNEYIKTDSTDAKESLLEQMPFLKAAISFMRNFRRG